MNSDKIRIELELKLENELFHLLEGDMVESVLKEASLGPEENIWKNILQGHSFKVTPEMASPLYNLFLEVKEALGYKKNIDFYITNTPELNAFAIPQIDEKEADIINVNSGMIGMLDDDELRFVVGHEIGHLISRFARINRLIYFVFPVPDEIPLILQNKIELWKKLSELTSDRFGYLACSKIDKCASAFFKMASGLDPARINFDYQAYLTENEKILDYFSHNNGNIMSHPVNPLRIKAIQLFSQSGLFQAIVDNKDFDSDEKLSGEMAKLIEALLTLSTSELDYHRKFFMAAAGIIMASLDEKLSGEEIELILDQLSAFTVFPKEFLNQIYDGGKANEIFGEAITQILALNPSERISMIAYLANLAISDNQVFNKEIDFVYEVGVNLFKMDKREVAQIVASMIQGKFMPNLYR
jgi:hypothetical protein